MNPKTTKSLKVYLPSLDALRTFAAFAVVAVHPSFPTSFGRPGSPFIYGHIAVDFFFVLSGFVMMLNYKSRDGVREALYYLQSRFARVYPLHAITLLAFLGVEFLKYIAAIHWGLVSKPAPFSPEGNSLFALFCNATLLNAHGLVRHLSYNYPAWSIGAEATCYIIFAATILKGVPRKPKATALIYGFLSIASFLYFTVLGMPGRILAVRGICGFSFGVLVYLLTQTLQNHSKRWISWGMFAVLISGVLLCVRGHAYDLMGIYFVAAGVISILVFQSQSLETSPTILDKLGASWFGDISYGVYMWHGLVLFVVNRILCQLLKYPNHEEGSSLEIAISIGFGNFLLASVCVVTALLARLSFIYIEDPLRRALRPSIACSKGSPPPGP